MTIPKKLIEVALPLEAINIASAREKSIRHGHPSTLHLWWARRPLAAARAVIFAQMVDDPSSHPDLFPTEKAQEKERQKLFQIIEDLVLWENTTNEDVLQRARDAIWESWRRTCAANADHPRAAELFDRRKLPAFHDPFAGGGALPLEAQRLGLESYASDLNPVAVLINNAMIEIPPKFAGKPPINPEARKDRSLIAREWKGAHGLAEDVRYYGQRMRDEAEKRIGDLYPPVEVTADMVAERPDLKPYLGKKLTVIAWLWARTVKSPNPAFRHVDVPLASTFMLSTKAGKEAYVEPVIENGGYRFTVKVGKPEHAEAAKNGTKLSRGANFMCLMSGTPMDGDYIKAEGAAGRLSARLMAIVAGGDKGRVYLSPIPVHESVPIGARLAWKPETPLPDDPRNFWTVQYGLTSYGDLFTPRQLLALTTFSDLVGEARELTKRDALAAGMAEGVGLADGGGGAKAYAEAVGVYLGFAVSKISNIGSSIASWMSDRGAFRETFARQAIPMTWDYAEANPFADAGGSFGTAIDKGATAIDFMPASSTARVKQLDASTQDLSFAKIISTDPPYYDNIGYADLSDFFYVWLRRSQKSVFEDLFATLAVPKAEELVATPYRHGGREKAEAFFLGGMTNAMHRLAELGHPAFPVTVYYAFKQAETASDEGTTSTGWETFLAAVTKAGFSITGTWPVRTEGEGRIIAKDSNALASSIVLVCRQRQTDASTITRREFQAALKAELPPALVQLQKGNIAPVDLAQAAIGPGMAVYSRYAQIIDASGKAVTVREALALINQVLDETLAEQEGDFDAATRWAVAWFEQFGFAEGEYGDAETLSKAKDTSIGGLADAGIVSSGKGKVRLLPSSELDSSWDPVEYTDSSVWEVVHQLVRVFEAGGDVAAAVIVKGLGSRAEVARELCYRLYTLCERKKRAQEALSYNALVQSWPELQRLAQGAVPKAQKQKDLFEGDE
jgi:putative DNA methylase